MKKNRTKLHLDREIVRTLSARAIEVVAGGEPKPSTDSDCVYCPLYSIPVKQCPMISREVVCTVKK